MIDSLKVFLLGFTTVFIALALLIFVIYLVKSLLGWIEKKAHVKKVSLIDAEMAEIKSEPDVEAETEDDTELAAVIIAAISAMTGKSSTEFYISKFKRVSDGSPAWNLRSRKNQLSRLV